MEKETTERYPYVPFVGGHAAQLLDMKADEYLQSGDNIVAGVSNPMGSR